VEEQINAVQFTRRFDRAFKHKTKDLRQAVLETIEQLKTDPSYPSLRVKKVRGINDIWEASVTMKHRITFEYSTDVIIFRNCNGHEVFAQP
jgi:mRNA-degrading endonuclease YafQ of YafQ-DinJ toxin-antitoxin module